MTLRIALIGACVSVATVLVNLFVTWRNHVASVKLENLKQRLSREATAELEALKQRLTKEATVELETLREDLRRSGEADKRVRELKKQSELLRIRSWELISLTNRYSQSSEVARKKSGLQIGISEHQFIEEWKCFSEQVATFLDEWAEVRDDFPETILDTLRSTRHLCKHLADQAKRMAEEFGVRLAAGGTMPAGVAADLVSTLNELNQRLDEFQQMIRTVSAHTSSGDDRSVTFIASQRADRAAPTNPDSAHTATGQ